MLPSGTVRRLALQLRFFVEHVGFWILEATFLMTNVFFDLNLLAFTVHCFVLAVVLFNNACILLSVAWYRLLFDVMYNANAA